MKINIYNEILKFILLIIFLQTINNILITNTNMFEYKNKISNYNLKKNLVIQSNNQYSNINQIDKSKEEFLKLIFKKIEIKTITKSKNGMLKSNKLDLNLDNHSNKLNNNNVENILDIKLLDNISVAVENENSNFIDPNLNNYLENSKFDKREFDKMIFKTRDSNSNSSELISTKSSSIESTNTMKSKEKIDDIDSKIDNGNTNAKNSNINSFFGVNKFVKDVKESEITVKEIKEIKDRLSTILNEEMSIDNFDHYNLESKVNEIKSIFFNAIKKHMPDGLDYEKMNKYMILTNKFLKKEEITDDFIKELFLGKIRSKETKNNDYLDNLNSFIETSVYLNNKDPNADITPPEKYSDSTDVPCISSMDCFAKKLIWMKCTVMRIGIRTAYETMNMPLRIIGNIVFGLCACSFAPAGEEWQLQANNRNAQPGTACNLPNKIYKALFKASFMIWNAYTAITGICRNPIGPL